MAQSQARLSENRLSVASAENVSLAEEAQVSQVRCKQTRAFPFYDAWIPDQIAQTITVFSIINL